MIQKNNNPLENIDLPSNGGIIKGANPDLSSTSFGPFKLDPSNALLLQNGDPIPLTPKAFAVLSYLIKFAGELVTKDAIFKAVWPNVIVTEAALTVCIREIRKALTDSTRKPMYIETVYKRGFRFIGNICSQVEPGHCMNLPMRCIKMSFTIERA